MMEIQGGAANGNAHPQIRSFGLYGYAQMKTMALPTIIIGLLLVAVGYWGFSEQTVEPKSKTALIPAYFGLALIVLGVLSTIDGLRKHVMHLAAIAGLFGAIGGLYPIFKQATSEAGIDIKSPSVISSASMVGLCVLFVFLCVRSFINVRKAREAAARAANSSAV